MDKIIENNLGEATKATKALEHVDKLLDGESTFTFYDCDYVVEPLEESTWKTIRKALELLDKVERGGSKGEFSSIFINEVNGVETVYVPFEDLDKYILIERDA